MTAGASLGAVARLALALALIFWGERAAAAEPIKIGLVHPFTGPLLTGITSSAEACAVRDYIDARQMPRVIMGNAGANDITDKRGSRYIFRTSFSNYQDNAPFGPYACTKRGYRQVAVMFSDFVTGYEMSGGFEGSFMKSGCAVVTHVVEKIASDVDQFWQPK